MSAIELENCSCPFHQLLDSSGDGRWDGMGTRFIFSRRRAYSSRTSCSRGVKVWPGPAPTKRPGGGVDMLGGGEV